ncbi:thiamine phosphate synthase [uncultured Alistipes sp.]|uniref:thiamine phosphate synthase n=1 Tax=uncultured Alistipes sp. TaxID=538949 RepID=UPI002665A091|nr:thiamine phosphate synthase [uncultured Alistipes sp.]
MMRILVITDVPFTATEPAAIRQLLDEGVERVHLRKPDASEEALRRLIEALPAECYPRLTLQDRLPLAVEYGLGGVHLNRRNAAVPAGFRGLVSRSCHTLDEIAAHPACDYLFLSPLFDSISKSGYRAAFTDGELRDAAVRGLLGERVVALGGIRPELLPRVRELGFGGAALLGAVWRDASPAALHRTMEHIRRFNI